MAHHTKCQPSHSRSHPPFASPTRSPAPARLRRAAFTVLAVLTTLGCESVPTPTGPTSSPARAVSALNDVKFVQVSAGYDHTCAVSEEAELYCWGANDFLQLGTVGFQSPKPVRVDQVAGAAIFNPQWSEVSSGKYFSCATFSADEEEVFWSSGASCWGAREHFQRGEGPDLGSGHSGFVDLCYGIGSCPPEMPVPVVNVFGAGRGTRHFAQVSAGGAHACGVRAVTGDIYCWGANESAQLGSLPVGPDKKSPSLVIGGKKSTQVSAGGNHSCAVGFFQVFCWGMDSSGQVGDGTRRDRADPNVVLDPTGGTFPLYTEVDAGADHSCAVTLFHEVFCWGGSRFGQLGVGNPPSLDRCPILTETFPCSLRPVRLFGGQAAFTQVSAGDFFTCGIAIDGLGYCWGANVFGELGAGLHPRLTEKCSFGVPCVKTHTSVLGAHRFIQISAGGDHACGVTIHHEIYCWGRNDRGQLGHGTLDDSPVPVRVVQPF
jgi:alpha-tubulin suppressor-like RCC1 family protein